MCGDYRRLFDAYQKAMAEHSRAVAELTNAASGHANFHVLWRACENARLGSERARIALDAHITEHGCVERARTV